MQSQEVIVRPKEVPFFGASVFPCLGGFHNPIGHQKGFTLCVEVATGERRV